MKQIFAYIIVASFCITLASGQSDGAQKLLDLTTSQQSLRRGQDSLQRLLITAREQLASATEEQKAVLSTSIVRFEGELFDVRSKISQVGAQIAAIEEQYAESTLIHREKMPVVQSAVLYQNPFFLNNLPPSDINTIATQPKAEAEILNALAIIAPLYDQLTELKKMYDQSIIQSEVDEIRNSAATIKNQITSIDEVVGQRWNKLYNYLIELYLVMLDKAPDKDRATIEAIEIESRDVRRAESVKQSESLTPQLAAFDLQRNLLQSYQKAIAKAAQLKDAYNALVARKITPVRTTFPDIEFLPRVLTVYGPVMTNYTYPSDNVADLPEMIIPEKGVYYSIQIALMSNPAKSVDMFKKVWPIQWQKTADGKNRYLAGGFHSYDAASKSLATLTKAGFKYPVLLAWNNGVATTTAKAKLAEKPAKAESASSYKVVVLTKNPAAAEIIKSTVDTHAKGRSIIRMAKGDELQFTVTEFIVREEADVLAQILRERTEASVVVEPIEITR